LSRNSNQLKIEEFRDKKKESRSVGVRNETISLGGGLSIKTVAPVFRIVFHNQSHIDSRVPLRSGSCKTIRFCMNNAGQIKEHILHFAIFTLPLSFKAHTHAKNNSGVRTNFQLCLP